MVSYRNGVGGGEPSFSERASCEDAVNQAQQSAAKQWAQHLEELQAYVGLYAAAHADLIRARIRAAAVNLALGTAAGVAGLAALVVCVYMALRGISGGLAELLGNRAWAGDLIVGAGLLLVVGLSTRTYLSMQAHAAARRTKDEYARRRQAIVAAR
jgi:hypothetical protein